MKLLVVMDHRFYGGADGVFTAYDSLDSRFFADYTRAFDEVRVAARMRHDARPAHCVRADGSGVTFLPLPDVQGARWIAGGRLLCGPVLADAVQWTDVVCLRIPSVSGRVACRYARRAGKPYMFEMIGDPIAATQVNSKRLLERAAGLVEGAHARAIVRHAVAGSYVSKAHLQGRYPPGPSTVIESISSIRLPRASIQPARRIDAAPAPLQAVLLASLVPVKRHEVLLRALAHARGQGADARLQLVGDGPMRPRIEALVRELGLDAVVTLHGHVASRQRINAILDSAELFVMTSATEGMPRSMIEAMARGLPAVGNAVGGIAEILPPEQLVPSGDIAALGDLLARLARDRRLLGAMAEHSHETALAFAQERLAERRQHLFAVLREFALLNG